jgi:hypothetical protein
MSAQSFTNLELDAPFPNGILPDSIDASNRNSSGLLTDTSVSSIVKSLKSRGIIPVLSTINNNEHVYRSKADTLLKSCKKEYDHYYARYVFVLNALFTAIRDQYTVNSSENQSKVSNSNRRLLNLNTKLNDLIQIMQGITNDMLETSNAMDAELKEFQKNMAEKKEKLKYQTDIIKSSQGGVKLSREMVKYTEENARYTDNLLKMYSFLNVVALGLLIYIYRAAN